MYLAQDDDLQREVAVSVLTNTAVRGALRTRLLREIRATAALGGHEHIVTVHDVRDEDGLTFVVTQLAPGGSVADRLRRTRPRGLPVSDAVRIARDVADALAHAHAHDVIHRDVKPGNILLTAEGGAVLADFGIARLADRTSRPRTRWSAPSCTWRPSRLRVARSTHGAISTLSAPRCSRWSAAARRSAATRQRCCRRLPAGRRPTRAASTRRCRRGCRPHSAPA